MTRPFRLAALDLASALVLAACGSASTSSTTSTTSTPSSTPRPASVVGTRTSSLGTFLVDAKGRALYLWEADHGSKSTCSGACAEAWPR
jgi:predicted lipoprotein with Yx(FWY)xxD motif